MKKTLIAKYDVTDLSDRERERLEMEVAVQAEASDPDEGSPGHPDVPVETEVVVDGPELTQDHFDAIGVALDLMLATVNEDEPAPRTRDVLWAQERLHDLIDRFGQFQNFPSNPARRRPRRREILVHLNVEAPDSDPRDADQIADEVLRNINGGQEPRDGVARPLGGSLFDLQITVPLAEEVHP